MRLTADLLHRAEQRTNCLGERELVLAGLGIPAVENTAAVSVQRSGGGGGGSSVNGGSSGTIDFDCLDLSNNLLIRLDNFSRWHRLSNLLVGGNRIETLDGRNLGKNVPNLKSLTLSHNKISSLVEIQALGKACRMLEFLDLTGNPVTRRPHYRLYTINSIPSLRCLDFSKVKREERIRAARLANSAAGAALESDIQLAADAAAVKTFTPGESTDGATVVTLFTVEEREAIRTLLSQATSVQEVEEIENAVQRGILPEKLILKQSSLVGGEVERNTTDAPSKRQKVA